MRNEGRGNSDGSSDCFGDDTSVYSLVSEANESHSQHQGAGGESKYSSGENENGAELGLLIVDGDEEEDGEGNDESERSKTSASLSIPETVFLPSEMRSVTAVSCVTHEQDKHTPKDSKAGTRIIGAILSKWNHLTSCLSIWISGLGVRSFNGMQIFPALVIFLALVSFTSWRSHVWKNEALRLREELRTQSILLPLTLSLLKERESLIKKQKLLEEEVMELSKMGDGPGKYNFEGILPPEQSEDEALLSFKNCYVEASLSLGLCSKDLQKWWSDTDDSSAHDANKDTSDNEYFSYDDGFTEDMSKLVRWGYDSIASTTAQSYSFIEKNLKQFSYVGMKDVFSFE